MRVSECASVCAGCTCEYVCVCVVYLGASTQAEHCTSAILCLRVVCALYGRSICRTWHAESLVREEAQDCEQIPARVQGIAVELWTKIKLHLAASFRCGASSDVPAELTPAQCRAQFQILRNQHTNIVGRMQSCIIVCVLLMHLYNTTRFGSTAKKQLKMKFCV